MIHLPKETGAFDPAPEGNHLAVCYRIVDLGTQPGYDNRPQHKIHISWELSNEHMEDGRPWIVSKRYTLSMSRMANLRKDLESWRGRRFASDELGAGGFNLRDLLGVAAMVNVAHNRSEDRTYANVVAIAPVPKGIEVPEPLNELIHLSLEPEEFDRGVYEDLPEWMQDLIYGSPEFERLTGGSPVPTSKEPEEQTPSPSTSTGNRKEHNDNIPF